MNKRVVLVVAGLLLTTSAIALNGNGGQAETTSQAAVFFIGFEVELFVPASEGDIEQRGCRYLIDRQSFLKELQPDQSRGNYDNHNVRGEVIFSENTRYFIDRNGIVRLGDKEFMLDKGSFSRAIKSVRKC